LSVVKLSANWMAAAGSPGEDAALFDTVRAVALDLCPALGISIPVGKDSMSMRTAWADGGERREVVSPLSLIVSAFAPCDDVRGTLTPQLRLDCGPTVLVLADLAPGRARLGGSVLAQVFGQIGHETPDVDHPAAIRGLFSALRELRLAGRVLAYHDRSDGGLFVALCEMAFAGRAGLVIDAAAVAGTERQGTADAALLANLFSEELGAVVQVREDDAAAVIEACARNGVAARVVARQDAHDRIAIVEDGRAVYERRRVDLHRAWSETTWQMQSMRDNPACALQEYDRILDRADPGLSVRLTFDPADDVAAPFVARGARPAIAILRDQGVNGEVEMAAAFDRAGFDAHDVHMSDVIAGRVSLSDFRGLAACGGFSFGDVLGGGEGWAKSALYNARARDEFSAFFERPDTFALGVCNGCQMMAALKELIPGAGAWPRFVKNASEQFEARVILVEILRSPSIFFTGMEGSLVPIVTAHGEGRALFDTPEDAARAIVPMRAVDTRGNPTETYPYNPNGSPGGLAGVTTADGRFTIVMPHPERVFRSVQWSWHPDGWGEDAPWMRVFRNARAFLG
jgi:phosphoribosylformylglycinamidine synthase